MTAPQPAPPCALVIFGAGGDLTKRLLFPALYNLAQQKLLPDQFAIVGFARTALAGDAFAQNMRENLAEYDQDALDPAVVDWLVSRMSYIQAPFDDQNAYVRLRDSLAELDRTRGTAGNYLFYLATAPDFFLTIPQHLCEAGLLTSDEHRFRRVVVEKPFGQDLTSAQKLNVELGKLLREDQIYRIDHYLGKETVQNILVFRFANGIFEPVWNRRYIDHVEITVAESVGVETRGGYYDHTGALRDMVPNHLLQLLALTCMEPPSSFAATALHNEQVEVLDAIGELCHEDVPRCAVRGQYAPGEIDGKPVPGYRQEQRVDPNSNTETYVALKLMVDNWRWAGVPFYLRTGKRLTRRTTEIAISFRRAPLSLFRNTPTPNITNNLLVIHIQPEEGITLHFDAKAPGPLIQRQPVAMNFDYKDYFQQQHRTGYETLVYDAMAGDRSLFKRGDMVEAGWRVVQPILEVWGKTSEALEIYPAGSAGPAAADELLARDGCQWRPL